MTKIIKGILLCIISVGLLIGCSGSVKEKNVENFIINLVSSDTYKNISNIDDKGGFIEDCKRVFADGLTDEALDLLMANRTFIIYSNVLSESENVIDVEITKTSETKNDGYIHMEYEVTYKLEYSDKTVDMTDYMAFNILDEKPYLIDKVSVSDKTSSVFKSK